MEECREEVARGVEQVGEDSDLPEERDRDEGANPTDNDSERGDPEQSHVRREVSLAHEVELTSVLSCHESKVVVPPGDNEPADRT